MPARKKFKPVYSVAINDHDLPVYYIGSNGKKRAIDSYVSWTNMLKRCFGKGHLRDYPTYVGCTVSDDWLRFSDFKKWYDAQYKESGWTLDKDILCPGNKEYCPEKCIFIPKELNTFVGDSGAKRGDLMIGVTRHKQGRFEASCMDLFFSGNRRGYIGLFDSEIEAHLAWKRRKHELACMWAEEVSDPRLKQALRTRYI